MNPDVLFALGAELGKLEKKKQASQLTEEQREKTSQEKESKLAREHIRKLTNGSLQLSEQAKALTIRKAFTQRDLTNRNPDDMLESTLIILLNKYTEEDEANQSDSEQINEKDYEAQRRERKTTELQILLKKKDNEPPEIETESQVDEDNISGSEEEDIQHQGAGESMNRDDLPEV